MKIKYDFHIHSGLSPCADDDMTPVTIVGYSAVSGIDMVAIADHNAIANVKVAMMAGEAYDVVVVPAMELQTTEDIHILCLFRTYTDLEAFYNSLEFVIIDNKVDIFGNQNVYDEDDEIIGTEKRLLLTSAKIASYEVKNRVEEYGGIAIPAHIDRESNSMLFTLGAITEEFDIVELSTKADEDFIKEYEKSYRIIIDSDAHTLDGISVRSEMELTERSIDGLWKYLKGDKT